MVSEKYQQYIKEGRIIPKDAPKRPDWHTAGLIAMEGGRDFGGGINFRGGWSFITAPFTMVPKTHAHDCHQLLWFVSGDPNYPDDLGGEAEVCFGEERGKYTIDKPTVIHVAPGLVHCPLTFRRVDKPFLFADIVLAPEYIRLTEYPEVEDAGTEEADMEKYTQYIKTAPFRTEEQKHETKEKRLQWHTALLADVQGEEDFGGIDFTGGIGFIKGPFTMVDVTH